MPLVEAEKSIAIDTVRPPLIAVKVIDQANDEDAEEFLSSMSPKHKPWDQHRAEADEVEAIYGASATRRHQRHGERVAQCSQILHFARDPPTNGTSKLKLKAAWFCRVRLCPVCQYRRSMQWQARLYQ